MDKQNLLTTLDQMCVEDLEIVATVIQNIIAEKRKNALVDDLRRAWHTIENEGYSITWEGWTLDVNDLEIIEEEEE